jgi:hypothetical protein
VVSILAIGPNFTGSNPAEDLGFLRATKFVARFLRKGNKVVGPMS